MVIFSNYYFFLSAVRCNTNPCELGGNFLPPNYNCIELPNNFNDVICTCPDGQGQLNARCRKKYLLRF
jgi:hypothetical protein